MSKPRIEIHTLTLREEKSKKANKPALARSVRSAGSSSYLFPAILPANDPRSILLKSRARIELLWERFLKEIQKESL